MNRELAAQRWGYVQIAVAAYVYLLEHLREADSTLFAREIICQHVAKPVHFYHRLVPADACLSGRAESESVGLLAVCLPQQCLLPMLLSTSCL